MAGTVTITLSEIDTPSPSSPHANIPGGIKKVEISWIADSGDGSVPQTAFDSDVLADILGRYCILGITDPGSPAPTDQYDIELLDEYGVDVFGENLKDRSATAGEQAVPKIGSAYGGRLCAGTWTFKLTGNFVNSAQGKCLLHFEI